MTISSPPKTTIVTSAKGIDLALRRSRKDGRVELDAEAVSKTIVSSCSSLVNNSNSNVSSENCGSNFSSATTTMTTMVVSTCSGSSVTTTLTTNVANVDSLLVGGSNSNSSSSSSIGLPRIAEEKDLSVSPPKGGFSSGALQRLEAQMGELKCTSSDDKVEMGSKSTEEGK